MDKAEKNRALAEWIGWKGIIVSAGVSFKEGTILGLDPREKHGPYHPIPDFYSSEEASALLRERLRSLDCQILMDRAGVTVYGPLPKVRGGRVTLVRNEPITMEAIAEAALRLMESGK